MIGQQHNRHLADLGTNLMLVLVLADSFSQ